MGESLDAAQGNTLDYLTTSTNTTGQFDPVVEIQPDDGVGLILKNHVDVGQKRQGFSICAALGDGGNSQFPLDTQVAIPYETPTDDNRSVVSTPRATFPRTTRRRSASSTAERTSTPVPLTFIHQDSGIQHIVGRLARDSIRRC